MTSAIFDDEVRVELRDYARTARRRWKLILGSVLAVVALAALVTSQVTPQYASTARVFISTIPNNSGDALQGSQYSQERVASYADVVNGVELSQRVVDDLGLEVSAPSLAKRIKAEVVPETVVLQITATDPSAAQAQRIANDAVKQLQGFVARLETPPGKRVPLLKASVVDPARLPDSPVSPQPLLNYGLGLVIGLLLGLGLALLRELADTSVKSTEDVPALREVPVLAGLPYDSEVSKKPLISGLPSHAPRAEAFRVLRTNLSFIDVDQRNKAFVVTSSVPGEGKSTTAINAAIAMAGTGQRVLLIDGDLRRPQVASLLKVEPTVGLTTVLVGRADLDAAIQQHGPSGLDVLTSGSVPPNPAELLQSQAMHELLRLARDRYDVIILDAPPLLPVTDAALMAAETDGAVLVVRHGSTTKDQVDAAVNRLVSVGSAPLGVVLNMVPAKRGGSYGDAYGYGYAPDADVFKAQRKERAKERENARG